MASYGQTTSTLWGPRLLKSSSSDALEVSIHTLPRPLQREFQHVFHEKNLNIDSIQDPLAEFLAIPTNQCAKEDLVGIGDHIEEEKDRLLNVYMDFAQAICQRIRDAGYWADYIDPCSGLPMITPNCNKVYSEVDGMECCLGTNEISYRRYNHPSTNIVISLQATNLTMLAFAKY
jgi:hypothetical protein